MANLNIPLDPGSLEGLRHLGNDIITDKHKRAAFLKDPQGTLTKYNVHNLNAKKLDAKVIDMLANPGFAAAVESKDINAVRKYVQTTLGPELPGLQREGSFDFDFDVEVEVEIVVIAIGVFDFAGVTATPVDPAQLARRQAIVTNAFAALGKRVGQRG